MLFFLNRIKGLIVTLLEI